MHLNLRAGVCVSGAVFRGDRLLLLRRTTDSPGTWELPGGSVEVGEGLAEALQREVREETGLSVRVGRPFAASTFEADGHEGRRVTVLVIQFLCTTPSRGTPQLSPTEHDAYAWIERNELGRYRIAPGRVRVVTEAFRVHRARVGARTPT
jgi:8-oxo-dGTP diphosphatase